MRRCPDCLQRFSKAGNTYKTQPSEVAVPSTAAQHRKLQQQMQATTRQALACATGAYDADRLAAPNAKASALKNGLIAKGLVNVPKFDKYVAQRGGCGGRGGAPRCSAAANLCRAAYVRGWLN